MAEGGDQDSDSKTEDPSQKKLEESLQKGQVAHSKEVTSFILFLLMTIIAVWIIPESMKTISSKLRYCIENAGSIIVDRGSLSALLVHYVNNVLLYFSPIFILVIIVAIFSFFMQTGTFIFTGETIKPDLSKLSIFKGYKRIVSIKSLVEFLKGIFKITLVGILVYFVILADIKELTQYQELSIAGIIDQLKTMIYHIMILITAVMAAIAGVDFAFQKYDHFNKLKMTKQEVKDEYKQSEGSPEVKKKIANLRSEQHKKRLNQTVPEATVVITNPTHYAVALRYIPGETEVPQCVAKGMDNIAERIKELAKQHDIPVVDSPPLARGLYKDMNVDDIIPKEYFDAVAQIISYVMSLEAKKKQQKQND